jgi:hypothetical protein
MNEIGEGVLLSRNFGFPMFSLIVLTISALKAARATA